MTSEDAPDGIDVIGRILRWQGAEFFEALQMAIKTVLTEAGVGYKMMSDNPAVRREIREILTEALEPVTTAIVFKDDSWLIGLKNGSVLEVTDESCLDSSKPIIYDDSVDAPVDPQKFSDALLAPVINSYENKRLMN